MKYLSFLLYVGLTLHLLSSCTNEDETFVNSSSGLETNADLLKLVDNGTNVAGELSITTSVSDVKLIWNTNEACNLDTTLLSVTAKNGRYILPIKWQKKLTDGKFGPEGTAYKAGVKIIAGDYSKYVPLIWAEKIDTAKVMESMPISRAAGEVMPRLAQINMIPNTVKMNQENGGSMYIDLSDASFAVFDLSDFTSDTNIDMSKIPTSITSSRIIDFKWNSKGAPSYAFSANLIAYTEGITQIGVVTYTPSGTSGSILTFKESNLPSGNIPYTGGTYIFTFDGNYVGGVQVRCLVNGVVVNTGNAAMNKQPQVTVPSNNTTSSRNVTFQYKRADGDWLSLPVSVNKTQDFFNSEYVVVNGIKWARGNLLYKNGVYSFYPNQYDHSDVNGHWTASKNPDYFAWNNLVPGLVRKNKWNYGDPCSKISGGKWRTPTYKEQESLIVNQNNKVAGKYPGTNIVGLFVGRNTVPTTVNEAESCLFLPSAGCCVEDANFPTESVWNASIGYYWNNDNNSIPSGKCLFFDPSNSMVKMESAGYLFIAMSIRCVRRD